MVAETQISEQGIRTESWSWSGRWTTLNLVCFTGNPEILIQILILISSPATHGLLYQLRFCHMQDLRICRI